MRKKDNGVTLVALVVTIIVLLILAGVSLSMIKDKKGIIDEARTATQNAQRESIIQKIEADLYNEKLKRGKEQTKEDMKQLIEKKGYASSLSEDELITKEGNYIIQYNEIVGWK